MAVLSYGVRSSWTGPPVVVTDSAVCYSILSSRSPVASRVWVGNDPFPAEVTSGWPVLMHMGDTKEGRDKKGHDEEAAQREHELETELEYEEAAEERRKEHEEEEAEQELADEG